MTFSLDQFALTNKVAIVTGAGGRGNSIGRAYAFGLANAGASVVVADLNGEGATRVADEITASGGKAIAVQVDITSPSSVKAMTESTVSAFGGIDILVNNAALMVEIGDQATINVDIDTWNKTLAVNLTGALNCAQAVVPFMQQRQGGKIINQVSGGAFPASTMYGISKLALVGLTTTLARELGPLNINVNAIAPGIVSSDAGKSLTPADAPFRQALEMACALRVDGQPDELVGALILLCSEAGGWMTGQVLHVDGGWVIRP